ncbi:DnaA ATPase domain-containing protein [Kaistia soli]|nr:DnaA/Hda family protein [Kaistia soli]
MSETRQLALELPHPPALTRADFIVGAANEAAIAMIDRYPAWPNRVAILVGPPGSGKTHLAAIWRESSGAAEVGARDLGTADLGALLASGAVLVEDIHAPETDPTALFHLLNLVREREAHALLTSRVLPAELAFVLPDLRSRLRAAVPVGLDAPDDALLAQVIVKLFADRQLPVDASLVDYLSRRIERSLEAAGRIVAALDAEALAAGRPLTRQLAAQVLARIEGEEG